jgi:hypothetical protein
MRRGNRLSATGLDQAITKHLAPAGDMRQQQGRRPSSRVLGLIGHIHGELPLELPLGLKEIANVSHGTCSVPPA